MSSPCTRPHEGQTKLSDLALICANCHRMIHRRAPWPTPKELRAQIETRRVGQNRIPAQQRSASSADEPANLV